MVPVLPPKYMIYYANCFPHYAAQMLRSSRMDCSLKILMQQMQAIKSIKEKHTIV